MKRKFILVSFLLSFFPGLVFSKESNPYTLRDLGNTLEKGGEELKNNILDFDLTFIWEWLIIIGVFLLIKGGFEWVKKKIDNKNVD
jgi:hypothetical protein